MKIKMILFYFVGVSNAIFGGEDFGYCDESEWRIEAFHYIYSGENGLNASVKETLHRDVYNAFSMSSALGKISLPAYMKIIIAETPEVFSALTKMPRDIAGCYDIKNKCLIIQHPYLLLRRGILSSTLYHESLHWMLMEKRGILHPDNYYYDEFLAEALSPSSDNIKATAGFFPDNYNTFLVKISNGISSKQAIRRTARDAAHMWGAYIIKIKGMDGLIHLLIDPEPEFNSEIMYNLFLNEIYK